MILRFLVNFVFVFVGCGSVSARIVPVALCPLLNSNESSLQDAVNNALSGDTLYIAPGDYSSIQLPILSASLVFLGGGYGHSKNHLTSNTTLATTLGDITFQGPGESLTLISLKTGHIEVNGCSSLFLDGVQLSAVHANNVNLVAINRSHVYSMGTVFSYWTSAGGCRITHRAAILLYNCGSVVLRSSIIDAREGRSCLSGVSIETRFYPNNPWSTITSNPPSQFIFDQCLVMDDVEMPTNTLLTNSILYDGHYARQTTTGLNQNNVGRGLCSGNCSVGYVGVQELDSLFVLPSDPRHYSSDGRYTLRPGSAAVGVSTSGGDCGPYGGLEPYVPSGLVNLPVIQNLSTSVRTGKQSGLSVTINTISAQ